MARRLGVVAVAVLGVAVGVRADPGAERRLAVLAPGMVVDRATDLVWTQDANPAGLSGKWDGLTWQEALRFVDEVRGGQRQNFGHTDWRLPRVDELRNLIGAMWRHSTSIEDLGRGVVLGLGLDAVQAPDSRGVRYPVSDLPFTNFGPTAFWTGTLAQDQGGTLVADAYVGAGSGPSVAARSDRLVWVVDTTGVTFVLDESARKRVWLVRGGPP